MCGNPTFDIGEVPESLRDCFEEIDMTTRRRNREDVPESLSRCVPERIVERANTARPGIAVAVARRSAGVRETRNRIDSI